MIRAVVSELDGLDSLRLAALKRAHKRAERVSTYETTP
jgi:hypothetical protein